MNEFKLVTADNLHNTIRTFLVQAESIIGDYDDMKDVILTMIKAGYMFNMDRDRLRDAMEDITYMLCPSDDANKDRVERGLEYDDDDDDDGYSSSGSDEDFESRAVIEQAQKKLEKKQKQKQQGSSRSTEYIISGDSEGSIVIEDIGDVGDIPDVS
jgi:hypothetical protein